MNKELLEKINETFNKSIANSNEETQLQIRILKNNINALFAEYGQTNNSTELAEEPKHEVVEILSETPVLEPTTQTESIGAEEAPDTLMQEGVKSILIVDDSIMIRNYLERIFINDYNIFMAVNGTDAIEKLEQNKDRLNIILLDLVMPKSDGFFVLEYLQNQNIDIPVIIISGDTSKESIERAFDYGVVDMIKKPFDSDIIKEKIIRYSK